MRVKKDIWWLKQKSKVITFYILLFLLPSQLALHFWSQFSFVFGIRVDYLSVAIYLTDILIFGLVFADIKSIIKYLWIKRWLAVFFLGLAIVNTVHSTTPVLSLIKWIHTLLLFLFAVYVSINRKSFDTLKIEKVLYFSLILISLVGIYQFFLGHTVGGILYYLGERSFSSQTPGIALFNIFGREVLRSYSTFSHPNSFAGFLGAVGTFLLFGKNLKKFPLVFLGASIVLFALIITFSFSALISLIFVGAVYLFEKRIKLKEKYYVWFLIILFSVSISQFFVPQKLISTRDFSWDKIDQRLELAYVSGKMVSERFWVGEGFNAFISNLPRFKTPSGYIWFLQPVHNIYLLLFSELGILGLVIFFIFISYGVLKLVRSNNRQVLYPILFILTSGLFDHYWLTLQQNVILMFLFFSYFI